MQQNLQRDLPNQVLFVDRYFNTSTLEKSSLIDAADLVQFTKLDRMELVLKKENDDDEPPVFGLLLDGCTVGIESTRRHKAFKLQRCLLFPDNIISRPCSTSIDAINASCICSRTLELKVSDSIKKIAIRDMRCIGGRRKLELNLLYSLSPNITKFDSSHRRYLESINKIFQNGGDERQHLQHLTQVGFEEEYDHFWLYNLVIVKSMN
jgi:hypothetical protein